MSNIVSKSIDLIVTDPPYMFIIIPRDNNNVRVNKCVIIFQGKSNLFEFQCNKYDNVKLDIEINGRRRTIDLHNIEKCSVIESIPNEIKNNKGYADISKSLQHIEKVALDYISEMILEIK